MSPEHTDRHSQHRSRTSRIHYRHLLFMAALSFMMFVSMYAMVNVFATVYLDANQFYMPVS